MDMDRRRSICYNTAEAQKCRFLQEKKYEKDHHIHRIVHQ